MLYKMMNNNSVSTGLILLTPTVDKILVEKMVETAKKVYENFKIPAKMIFDEFARKIHESATVCFACGKGFDGDKVRDHCHYTGKYRGALHSRCNLKLGGKTLIIPVLAHNNSGYDSHMFVKRLSDTERRVSCIAENEEKYITFSKDILVDVVNEKHVYVKLKFLDTFRFMDKSLAELVKTTTKFEHTDKYFTPEQQELLRRKEVYPYDYMTDFSKLSETKPPPREAFNSWLNSTGAVSSANEFDEMEPVEIADEDYDHFRPILGPNIAAITCEIRRYWAILEKIFKIHGDIRRYWAILGDTG